MWIIPAIVCVLGIALAMLPPATPEACPVEPAAQRRMVRWALGIAMIMLAAVLGFALHAVGGRDAPGRDESPRLLAPRKLVRYRYAVPRGRAARTGYLAPFRLAMYRHGLYAVGAQFATLATSCATPRSQCSRSSDSRKPSTCARTPSRSSWSSPRVITGKPRITSDAIPDRDVDGLV